MKQFMSRVKDLSQRAAEIKAAMQQVPPKVAEIRETVAATAGQLQQLKSQIGYSVADLRADNEQTLSEVLQEVGGSEEVLLKAGFVLEGVDIELSPVQRLLVHLAKIEDVHGSVLRSLATANQQRRTVHAILSALLQAQQMAATVDLENLTYCEVIIGVGPIPSIRLCWRPEALPAPVATALAAAAPPPVPAPVAARPAPTAVPATQAIFGPGSFFEKRTTPEMTTPAAEPVETAETQEPSATAPEALDASSVAPPTTSPEVPAPAASSDPLARFKKMPSLSILKK